MYKIGVDNMIEIKVTFEDGNYLHTKFNGTIETAKKYYFGNVFNLGEVVSVDLV